MADYNISAVPRRKVYTGSAGVGPYAFTFEVLEQTDITVYRNTTRLTLTTDYTVTINANGTGSVTLVSAATGADRIVIVGARDIERTTDFVTAGDLTAASLNEQLDASVIHSQQLAETLSRTIRAPVYDPELEENGGTVNMELPAAATRANNFLAFDDDGNPMAAAGTGLEVDVLNALNAILQDETGETITGENINLVSSFTNGLLDNADAAAWRTDLGLGNLAALNSVGAAQIDTGAVNTDELAAQAVTPAKVSRTGATSGLPLVGNGSGSDPAWQALTHVAFPNGTIIDRAYAEYTANTSLSTTTPADDTIPTISEGTEVLSASITPKSATNRVRVRVTGFGSREGGAGSTMTVAIHVNGGAAAHAFLVDVVDNTIAYPFSGEYEYVPGSTSAQAITVRVGNNSGGCRLNGTGGGRIFGGVARTTLILEEIKSA